MRNPSASRLALAKEIDATKDHFGIVTPERVVEAARDDNTALHREFEWDDSVAAHQHRLATARQLIREVRFEVIEQPRRVISAVSYVHHPGMKGQAYIPLGRAAQSAELARDVLIAECDRIESAIKRASEIADVLGLTDDLDNMLKALVEVRAKVVKSEKRKVGRKRAG